MAAMAVAKAVKAVKEEDSVVEEVMVAGLVAEKVGGVEEVKVVAMVEVMVAGSVAEKAVVMEEVKEAEMAVEMVADSEVDSEAVMEVDCANHMNSLGRLRNLSM